MQWFAGKGYWKVYPKYFRIIWVRPLNSEIPLNTYVYMYLYKDDEVSLFETIIVVTYNSVWYWRKYHETSLFF